MKPAPLPHNEKQRLKALSDLELLDTLPEEVYDEITKLASEICGTPIALLTLIDENRQWFKSKKGIGVDETPRDQAFCAHTILNPNEALIVPDARYDERFHDNPLTTGDPYAVFYAGVPLKDANDNVFGSLCVIDSRPRELSEQKIESLKALAKLVNVHFELRRNKIEISKIKSSFTNAMKSVKIINEIVETLIKSIPEHIQSGELKNLKQAVNSVQDLLQINEA